MSRSQCLQLALQPVSALLCLAKLQPQPFKLVLKYFLCCRCLLLTKRLLLLQRLELFLRPIVAINL
jgi:hypothetical protein